MIKRIGLIFMIVLFPCVLCADDFRFNVTSSFQPFPDFLEVSAEVAIPAVALGFRIAGMGYWYQDGSFDLAHEYCIYTTAYPFEEFSGINISIGYSAAFKYEESGYFNELMNSWLLPWNFNNLFYTTIGWKQDIIPNGSFFVFLDFGTKFQIKFMDRNQVAWYGRFGFGTKIF